MVDLGRRDSIGSGSATHPQQRKEEAKVSGRKARKREGRWGIRGAYVDEYHEEKHQLDFLLRLLGLENLLFDRGICCVATTKEG